MITDDKLHKEPPSSTFSPQPPTTTTTTNAAVHIGTLNLDSSSCSSSTMTTQQHVDSNMNNKAFTRNSSKQQQQLHDHRMLMSFPPSKTSSLNSSTTPTTVFSPNTNHNNNNNSTTTPNTILSQTPFSFFKRLLTKASSLNTSRNTNNSITNHHQTATISKENDDSNNNRENHSKFPFDFPIAQNSSSACLEPKFSTSFTSENTLKMNQHENDLQHVVENVEDPNRATRTTTRVTIVNMDAFTSSQPLTMDQNNHIILSNRTSSNNPTTSTLATVTPSVVQPSPHEHSQQQQLNHHHHHHTGILMQSSNRIGVMDTNENTSIHLGVDPQHLSTCLHGSSNSELFSPKESPHSTFKISANLLDQETLELTTTFEKSNHSIHTKKREEKRNPQTSTTTSTVTFQTINPTPKTTRKSRHASPLFRMNQSNPTTSTPKTYFKKLTFMESLSISADPSTSTSTTHLKNKHSNVDIVETDLLFNDLQVFQNQVVKRYVKILEQPMVCKAFNYEVLGPQNFLVNPYMGGRVPSSNDHTVTSSDTSKTTILNPQVFTTSLNASPKLEQNSQSPLTPTLPQQPPQPQQQPPPQSVNPYLFDEKFIQEYHWRRRRPFSETILHAENNIHGGNSNSLMKKNIPNVPTIDMVCEDGATLSCYFEFIGQQNLNFDKNSSHTLSHPSSMNHHQESDTMMMNPGGHNTFNSNNTSHHHGMTHSKKTVIFFHDGSEEAFEYFSHPSLRKFKDFILSMGLQIFIFEYRGFGFSTCARGEDERSSLHRFLETDCKLIHHLFITRLKIPMSDVIVYGKGFLGTTCAIHYVSKFPTVAGLCLESPCVDILKLIHANIPEERNTSCLLSQNSSVESSDLWNLNVRLEEEESIKFEFTNYNFGVEEYYRVKKSLKSVHSSSILNRNPSYKSNTTTQQQRKPNLHHTTTTTIACKVGDEKYHTMKELKNCILHHFNTVDKLSSFNGKLLILFQQGNELVPYGDIESFFKNVKTAEKNMYLLSLNEMTSSALNSTDDPFNLFERKFYACVKAIHRFVQSLGHVLPENYGIFLDKLLEKTKPSVHHRRPTTPLTQEEENEDLTSELSELATSSYVDTFQSFGGRGRKFNRYMPPCGGCGHCRACIDQSLLEEEERLGKNRFNHSLHEEEEETDENDRTERDLDDEYIEEDEEEEVIIMENPHQEEEQKMEPIFE
ncbi:hypothetical protein FDP41_000854 [Naegleria fowleri]|uniref:Uncharacterized protein n=1 Tax=Naegleria fowleri TaxID=5763 RepID=A0A6A5CI20_NAEFO|nr:uncharacterized protein FDP41_000854 [Naegleria fowleri]KAF0984955.1 hypothetical protein FDP41_000854 [Naegleria fowleri]